MYRAGESDKWIPTDVEQPLLFDTCISLFKGPRSTSVGFKVLWSRTEEATEKAWNEIPAFKCLL